MKVGWPEKAGQMWTRDLARKAQTQSCSNDRCRISICEGAQPTEHENEDIVGSELLLFAALVRHLERFARIE